MYNNEYEEYIRSVLGYTPENNNFYNMSNTDNQNVNYNNIMNSELEKYYPEIYKITYPMIVKKCNEFQNNRGNLRNEDLENMTDEIYRAIEENTEINMNVNLKTEINQNNTVTNMDRAVNGRNVRSINDKRNVREIRQTNTYLRDLIKILLIRELLSGNRRPGPMPGPRPPMPPRPPVPGPMPRPPFGR